MKLKFMGVPIDNFSESQLMNMLEIHLTKIERHTS